MNILRNLFALGFLVVLISCKKDPPSTPSASPLTGCCETPATNATFGNAKVYIPNIFTPNGDGINDLLMILTDSVTNVILFEVSNSENQTVYQEENFPPNNTSHSWDGYSNGELILGLYAYTVTLEAADGTISTFTGKSCNYPCGELGDEERISPIGCQFPAQVIDGQYNSNIPSFETVGGSESCFK